MNLPNAPKLKSKNAAPFRSIELGATVAPHSRSKCACLFTAYEGLRNLVLLLYESWQPLKPRQRD